MDHQNTTDQLNTKSVKYRWSFQAVVVSLIIPMVVLYIFPGMENANQAELIASGNNSADTKMITDLMAIFFPFAKAVTIFLVVAGIVRMGLMKPSRKTPTWMKKEIV